MTAAVILVLGLVFTGPVIAQGFLSPNGPVAADQLVHLMKVTLVTMIAVVPVLIGVPIILWRYRRGRGNTYRPDFDFSAPLEIAMWGGPTILILLLSIWLWRSTEKLDPFQPLGTDPLQVQVIGLNWKWLFIYPSYSVASIGVLAIPADRPVQLNLTSDSVMQSFWVPSLAGQVYVMPGMVTGLNLMADKPGQMAGLNSQYNGRGFANQRIEVQVMTDNDWLTWIEGVDDEAELNAGTYASLGMPSTDAEVMEKLSLSDSRLHLSVPDLFNEVVNRYRDGRALPEQLQPGAAGYQVEALK